MAPFTMTTLPGEPIISLTLSSDFKPPHIAEASAAMIEAVQQIGTQSYVVADIRELALTLGELVTASNIAARGSSAILHDDRVKAYMLVADNSLLQAAVRGLNSEAFGFVSHLFVYATPEEALGAARAAIAAEDSGAAREIA